MKKVYAAIIITVLIFTVSCVSNPVDLGMHDPGNTPEEDLVTLHVDGWCKISQIDNYIIDLSSNYNNYFIKLNPGVHTLYTKFDNGGAHGLFFTPVTARFEKGNVYYLDYDLKSVNSGRYKVTYHISLYNNKKKGKEVTGKPLENLIEILNSYFVNMESQVIMGKSAKLENEKYTLVYKPGGVYTQTDKKSGAAVKGKYVFENPEILYAMMSKGFFGRVCFFDEDAKIMKKSTSWGRKEYEEVDYGIAHTVLVLINFSEKEVIYRYEKPAELEGTEIIFNIMEVK